MKKTIEKIITLLKGKRYNIKSLLNETNIGIKLVSKSVKKNDYSAPFIFTNDVIILISIRKQLYTKDGDLYCLQYFSDNMIKSCYVHGDFKIQRVAKKSYEPLMKKLRAYQFSNLSLHYSGCVGSDPEIFIENKKGIIPAFNFLGSKKDKITKTAVNEGRGGTQIGQLPLYWDGFQAEFETYPATCLAWQVDSVQCGLKGALNEARKHDNTAKLSIKTVMDISNDLLKDAKDEHVNFGCMPSLNAYGMKGLDIPGREVNFRPAGGHIHFGIGMTTEKQAIPMIKALDAILGVACVSFFANYDDKRRRQLYGLAGEYRLPVHGVEYRVLSNAWLCHPLIMNIVFDLGRKALCFGRDGLMEYWDATEKETIECINTCDVKKAREILKRNEDVLKKIINKAYNDVGSADVVFKAFLNGIESIVLDPSDIEKNWNLSSNWIAHSDGPGKNFALSFETLKAKNKVS